MPRTTFAIASDVDRCLSLSLSNFEFEILANYLDKAIEPEKEAVKLINSGEKNVREVIENYKRNNY